MATLADQRAAIAAGITNARRSTAAAERQAIHDNMVARRTGEAIKENLNALETPRRKSGELARRSAKGGVPATTSAGTPRVQPTGTTSGGIASPLTEKTKNIGTELAPEMVADREYYPAGLPSSDGLLLLPAIKKQTFTDANGAEAVFDFATPGTLP